MVIAMQATMKNEGFYDNHSSIQRSVIEVAEPLIRYAAQSISLPSGQAPITIVDYGASEGANSVAAVNFALETIWQRKYEQIVKVIHEDQPQNNFNRLFENVYQFQDTEYSQAIHAPSGQSKLFVFASGCSFYGQVVPSASVDLGLSASAAHWLSSPPTVKNHIHSIGATKAEGAKCSELAAREWERFLKQRSAELRPGARLIVTMGGRFDEDGSGRQIPAQFQTDRKLPKVTGNSSVEAMMDLLDTKLKAMVQEGTIEKSAYERFSFPIYFRSTAEIIAPLYDEKSDVYELFTEEYVWVQSIPDSMTETFEQSKDAEAYADALINTVRAFTEPLLLQGLFSNSERRRKERQTAASQLIVDELFRRVRDEVIAAPDMYQFAAINSFAIFIRSENEPSV
jgi:SAM dependent carboxyl methyltransferase